MSTVIQCNIEIKTSEMHGVVGVSVSESLATSHIHGICVQGENVIRQSIYVAYATTLLGIATCGISYLHSFS